MIGKRVISATTTPSGVFRQPREDILQESVSQCAVNHDSLCKVSDFDISIHSKYNLPDLCTVDGQGRAVYWLYKHSLADSESVRNSKARIASREDTTATCDSTISTNSMDTVSNCKPSSAATKRKLKKKLRQLRGIFLSTTDSDIQIKETYNSYVNLTDLETADLLLKSDEHFSMDKYDNLMMNLEMRKFMLQKKHKEKKANAEATKKREKENPKDSIDQCLSQIMNNLKNSRKFKTKRNRNRKNEDVGVSLVSKSTDTDLLVRSGLGVNDLDYILNEIRYFMQSDKMDEITEAQKIQLEEYLRALTTEANRKYIKREIYQTGISNRLKESIRQNLRHIINTREVIQGNSLRVETDLTTFKCTSSNTSSLTSLKKCEAQYTIDINNYLLPPTSLLEDEEMPLDSFRSSNSDMAIDLSEKEINSEDLTDTRNYMEADTDSSDKLFMKRYQLDHEYDLFNFPICDNVASNECAAEDKPSENMDKFKSVRSFNESDTLKYFEMKQKNRGLKGQVKEQPDKINKTDYNICITAPDNISINSSLCIPGESKTKIKIKATSHKATSSKEKPTKLKPKPNESSNQRDKKSPASNQVKFPEINVGNKCEALLKSLNDIYACFKESIQVSSDSGNNIKDFSRSSPTNLKNDRDISSISFPRSKRSECESHSKAPNNERSLHDKESTVNEHKSAERRRKDRKKKDDDENKTAYSDNCLNSKSTKVKLGLKCGKEGEVNLKESKGEEKDTGDASKKGENGKFFLDKKNKERNNHKISSSIKPKKSTHKGVVASKSLDQKKETRMLDEDLADNLVPSKHRSRVINCAKSVDSIKRTEITLPEQNSSASNRVICINNSLIHIDEKSIFETTESENMLKGEMLNLQKSLICNCGSSSRTVDIPIYKQGYEIARLTRQSPSCAYTISNYVQKINKSTQMFEHVTRNDLYTLQWIHDNLFQINLNPYTLIIDEKIKELSEISDVSST